MRTDYPESNNTCHRGNLYRMEPTCTKYARASVSIMTRGNSPHNRKEVRMISFDGYETLVAASMVLVVGSLLVSRVGWLKYYSIPDRWSAV